MKRVLALILALLFLCSCASAPRTGRVSEEELAKLREEYPYRDAAPAMADYSAEFLTLKEDPHAMLSSWKENNFCALALIEITSKPYYTVYLMPHNLLPEDFPTEYWPEIFTAQFRDLQDFMSQYPKIDESTARMLTQNAFCYVDAEIQQVIWGNCGLEKGDTFRLVFGALRESDAVGAYAKGGRIVCPVLAFESESIPLKKTYSTSKYDSWHLTKNDVVLSVSGNYGADYFSGLYLESFKQELLAILNEE